ncbi:Transglutaminase-like domain protein [Labrenzia sp. THAF82]|uniref:transglutaminase-like cysteine peptidase n=1 Tax=Labrenzia sp. THAF82 TaxID=2587861 RepID=UPI0012681A55|nr:transglutaminase-like cysteine peptidase [Labrenzia sp. THAF82]QFT31617.1 Transglutaminase-like domain protein [Labrenzia sp. THAF82]
MEQSATASAVPAANRKVVPKTWQALICAIALQTAGSAAKAEETLPGVDDVQVILQASLLDTARASAKPAALHFSPISTTPTAKPVELQKVRIGPLAKPQVSASAVKTSAVTVQKPLKRTALKPTRLFGSLGKSVALSPVSKRWQRALGELNADQKGTAGSRHSFRTYTAILDQVKSKRRGLQIPKVNYMVNRLLAYREDHRLWKAGEYWASPVESLNKRAGDCEDYAILKYALLRDLGVKDEDMRVVVLRDTAARQYHAVLSVKHEGKWLILDNRFSRVRFERDLPHYQALYSVNAAGEWSHNPKAGKPVRLAARLKSANK